MRSSAGRSVSAMSCCARCATARRASTSRASRGRVYCGRCNTGPASGPTCSSAACCASATRSAKSRSPKRTCEDDAVDTDPRTIAILLARGRVVFGLVALVLPGVLTRVMFRSNSGQLRALMRMVGVRDIALGVGAITNLKEETQDAEWVSMGALSDGGDAIALLLAPNTWFNRLFTTLFSASAAAIGFECARRLADARAATADE